MTRSGSARLLALTHLERCASQQYVKYRILRLMFVLGADARSFGTNRTVLAILCIAAPLPADRC
jgi:hypothetical protein